MKIENPYQNEELVHSLKLNGIEPDKIEDFIELKIAASKLGWVLDDHDVFDGNIYITFATKI